MSETDCTQILEQIEVYLDQELDDAVRCAEIKRHLELCPPCMDHVEFRATLQVLIRNKCTGEEMPAGLQDRVAQAVREQAP